jgi:methyl-accepting chemotaxis protein
MSEVAVASKEQSDGIEQVNRAVSQIDQITQQNAALVEEATAAAKSLEEQADGLAQTISVFKLPRESGKQATPAAETRKNGSVRSYNGAWSDASSEFVPGGNA